MNSKESDRVQSQGGLRVANYLFLNSETQNAKRIRRRLRKNGLDKLFYGITCEREHSIIPNLNHFLSSAVKKRSGHIGILTDHNTIKNVDGLMLLPPHQSNRWDVLCLDSDVTRYDFKHPDNNTHWCRTDINTTHHFVINERGITKVLQVLEKCKNWNEFCSLLNELKLFTISQTVVSRHLDFNLVSENTYFSTVDLDEAAAICDSKLNTRQLPGVSLICPATDAKKIFHTLYCFLKLGKWYPEDKLELVIIDSKNVEKRLKSFLPNDPRIKMVNVTPKVNSSDNHIPLGHMLNLGAKYARHDIIYHCFDTCHYYLSNFPKFIKTLLVKQVDCIASTDTAFYNIENGSSMYTKQPSVYNMIYTKNYWQVYPFSERQTDPTVLAQEFLMYRKKSFRNIPFILNSFATTTTGNKGEDENLPFDLYTTIESELRESFDVSLKN